MKLLPQERTQKGERNTPFLSKSSSSKIVNSRLINRKIQIDTKKKDNRKILLKKLVKARDSLIKPVVQVHLRVKVHLVIGGKVRGAYAGNK